VGSTENERRPKNIIEANASKNEKKKEMDGEGKSEKKDTIVQELCRIVVVYDDEDPEEDDDDDDDDR
jgi:hypothetical protein